MGELNINEVKFIRNIVKESKRTAKMESCPICGKIQTSFCNSHSIPQFVLQNIACNGMLLQLYTFSSNIWMPVSELEGGEKGIKNSGTFQFICRDCDSKYFSDYENAIRLSERPTNKMMAEIEVKNFLMMLYKRNYETVLCKKVHEMWNGANVSYTQAAQKHDIVNYSTMLNRAKRIIEGKSSEGYKIIFWKKIPHKVPFACQSSIVPYRSISGAIVNDVYNIEKSNLVKDLHLYIFPLRDYTVVGLFCIETTQKRYSTFKREFEKLNATEKERYLCYLAFEYTENIFMSPAVNSSVLKNETLKKLAYETNGIPAIGVHTPEIDFYNRMIYKKVDWEKVPNLLDKKFAIQ